MTQEHPAIKRFVRMGELREEHRTPKEILEFGAEILDDVLPEESSGDPVWEAEDGKFYALLFTAYIGEVTKEYADEMADEEIDG